MSEAEEEPDPSRYQEGFAAHGNRCPNRTRLPTRGSRPNNAKPKQHEVITGWRRTRETPGRPGMSPEIVVLFHSRSLEIPRQATTWRRLFILKTKGAFGLFRRFRCFASGVVTGMVRWRCGGAVAYWASGQALSLQMPAGVVVYGRGQGGNAMPRFPANG
jgi:hypothetical protein